jgi:hypothetical protein
MCKRTVEAYHGPRQASTSVSTLRAGWCGIEWWTSLVMRFVTAKLKAATHRLRKRMRRIGTARIARSRMTHAKIGISNCLHYRCRYPLNSLLPRSERDEGDPDDNKHNGPDEFSACDQISESLPRHKELRGQSSTMP